MHATALHASLPATVLVCATPEQGGEPLVVLADGSYETGAERVFWRHRPDAEVLRLPLQVPVSVRPVRRFPEQRPAEDGERRLLEAVAAHRVDALPAQRAPEQRSHDAIQRRLAMALTDHDHTGAEALAGILWRQAGLAAAHTSLAECLDEVAAARTDGSASTLDVHQAVASVRAVLDRLRATSTSQVSEAPVVLVAPDGDGHTLALTALAHQLEEAGHRSLVVDDLPVEELAALLHERPVPAVVVSAHLSVPPGVLRHLIATLRAAGPQTLVVLGGPGIPRSTRGADLVTDDPAELLRLLAGASDPLTEREREVLHLVADGRTNGEIADRLCVSPTTVKTHLDHVLAKTGTEHRAAAVARALRQGWIT
jgi:DNA-binding NarL/FixJ family response regulator